jgi:hypothetical protein
MATPAAIALAAAAHRLPLNTFSSPLVIFRFPLFFLDILLISISLWSLKFQKGSKNGI